VWAGVDSVWEQEKPEAWKMPENAADRVSEPPASIAQPKRIGAWQSHTLGALSLCFIALGAFPRVQGRFVRRQICLFSVR